MATGNKMAAPIVRKQDGGAHNETGTRMAAGCHVTAVRLVPGSTRARRRRSAIDVVASIARDEMT